jgi:hypothetical protein
MIPECEKAHGRVTIPAPIIEFQTVKMVMNELCFYDLFSLEPRNGTITGMLKSIGCKIWSATCTGICKKLFVVDLLV